MSQSDLRKKPIHLFAFVVSVMLMTFNVNAQTCISSTPGANGVCVQHLPNNQYRFTVNYPGADPSDLIFWILPDGHWAFGDQIDWNLNNAGESGKVHILRKNDIDFGISLGGLSGGVLTYDIPTFNLTNGVSYGVNPSHNSGSLQVNSSWSAARGSWFYAIVSFTNTTGSIISSGNISLNFTNGVGYNFNPNKSAGLISSNWANLDPNTASSNTPTWNFKDLGVGEQRHLYVAFDVLNSASATCSLTASLFDGAGTTVTPALKVKTRDYPYDPNFVRIETESGGEYENYAYCNEYTEILHYTVGFQNDGTAPSKDVSLVVDIEDFGYQFNTLEEINSSHPSTLSSFEYNAANHTIEIEFEDINLPGLNTVGEIFSFQETTGYITFEIQTKCSLEEDLPVSASIVFVAEDHTPMPAIDTNTVTANFDEPGDNCTACPLEEPIEDDLDLPFSEEGGNYRKIPTEEYLDIAFALSPNPCKDSFTFHYEIFKEEEQTVKISLYDMAGKKQRNLLESNQLSKGKHQLTADIRDLESGVYIVNLQIDGQNKSFKLLKW